MEFELWLTLRENGIDLMPPTKWVKCAHLPKI